MDTALSATSLARGTMGLVPYVPELAVSHLPPYIANNADLRARLQQLEELEHEVRLAIAETVEEAINDAGGRNLSGRVRRGAAAKAAVTLGKPEQYVHDSTRRSPTRNQS